MLPAIVLALLRERIETFEQLQILLLLLREPDRDWGIQRVASDLRIDAALVTESFEHLRRVGLLEARGSGEALTVHLGPSDPALRPACEALARAFVESPAEVMRTLNANAVERVRTSAMRAFASAFILDGKGKKSDG